MDPRILLADDHGIVRMGLSQKIKQIRPGAHLFEVGDYESLYKLIAREQFDLAILDVKMPNGTFQDAVEYLKFKQPKLRILVFSSQDEQLYAVRYLKMGADGFLNKNSNTEDIESALDAMLSKGKYLSEDLKDAMIFGALNEQITASPIESLSNRELEVANKLSEGMTIKEMSDHFSLHTSTVSTYKNRIFEKLNINSVPELIEILRMYN